MPPYSNGINGNLCENTFDVVGFTCFCLLAKSGSLSAGAPNVPLDYASINGTYRYCLGDNQQVPNGQAIPIPATSQCTTYASTAIFAVRRT